MARLIRAQIEEADGTIDGGKAPIGHLPTRLHELERELMALRKAVLPLRDAVAALVRDDDKRTALTPDSGPARRLRRRRSWPR